LQKVSASRNTLVFYRKTQAGLTSALSDQMESSIDKKSRQIRRLDQVLIEKVCQRFRNLLARFPLALNHASDKKSRQIKNAERILVAKVCQLLRNAL
jgi:hypothetical protein